MTRAPEYVGRVSRTVHKGWKVVGDLSVDEGIGDVTEDKHGYREACSVKEGSQYAQHHEEGVQTSGIAELAGGGGNKRNMITINTQNFIHDISRSIQIRLTYYEAGYRALCAV